MNVSARHALSASLLLHSGADEKVGIFQKYPIYRLCEQGEICFLRLFSQPRVRVVGILLPVLCCGGGSVGRGGVVGPTVYSPSNRHWKHTRSPVGASHALPLHACNHTRQINHTGITASLFLPTYGPVRYIILVENAQDRFFRAARDEMYSLQQHDPHFVPDGMGHRRRSPRFYQHVV
jgi:hypothetical protein